MDVSWERYTSSSKFSQDKRIPGRLHHLFDLPVEVRKRIYEYACTEYMLRAYRSATFGRPKRGWPTARDYSSYYYWTTFNPMAALLLSCRTIHDEVFEIICSNNDLKVHLGSQGGLNMLYGLKPNNIAALRSLTVDLDLNKPVTPSVCYFPGYGHSICSKRRPKLMIAQELNLLDWYGALGHILPHLPQDNFRLNLICDLGTLPLGVGRKIAEKLLTPLDGILRLQSCSVSLSPEPNRKLSSLAEDVANKAMGIPPRQGQFRLLDLPQELRLQILSYTDLVTQQRQVEWTPNNYRAPGQSSCYHSEPEFCRRDHAAYSQSCQCWLTPCPILLTCKVLRYEGEQMFFEKNRIIVRPMGGTDQIVESTSASLEISQYLRTVIPAHALRHLRCLEIVFPPFEGAYLQESEPAYNEWLSVIDFVKDRLNCPQLVLRICFSTFSRPRPQQLPFVWRDMSSGRVEELFESYRRAVFPLSVLRAYGLRHLALGIVPPLCQSLGLPGDPRRDTWAASIIAEIEEVVLGELYGGRSIVQTESIWKLRWMDLLDMNDD